MGPCDFFSISKCKCGNNHDLARLWIKDLSKWSKAESVQWTCTECKTVGWFKYNMC